MVNTNKIVGQNVKKYIEGKGIKHSWVMERTGIKKTAYYNFLKGEGNVEEYVAKINKLFRITDPFFFYKADMELNEKTFERSRSDSFMNYVALSFHGAEDEEFKKGMHLFSEFVELIDVLKSVTNSEHPRG
ncbi:hypothetical protein ACWNXI_16870 [Caldibacillus thermoamylovorans]